MIGFVFSLILEKGKSISVLLLPFFVSVQAWAFPELVKHGYVNCSSCHVSPSGGGILSPYGRELSKEVLSTWGKDGEQAFVYNLVKPPEWLLGGGDVRAIQTYKDTATRTSGQLFLMQADLELAANYKQFTFDGTLGYNYFTPPNPSLSDYVISRRYYVNYKLTETLSFRAGKFLYDFGINTPDHFIVVRRGLQINDEGFETFNLEGAYIGENYNLFITGILGRPDSLSLQREKGISISPSMSLGGTYKVGLDYLYGSNDLQNRNVFGPFWILGFSPQIAFLSEIDFQMLNNNTASNGATQTGFASYNKFDYEFTQGFHGYLSQEFVRYDFSDPTTIGKANGIGFQFFPRPHFEFDITYELRTDPGSTLSYDYAYFIFHYYL